MALENFRTIELIWDKANKSIIKSIKTASSDTTGRYLSVKILDGGQEVTLNNAKLQLYWEHPNFNTSGTDDFNIVNNGGMFSMTFSDEMLTNIGELNAHLVLTLTDGRITSGGFPIEVFKGADDGVVVPTNGSGLVEQVAKKIDKGNVTLGDLTQEVKLAMTGGSVAVVGENAVDTVNIKDNAVTTSKIYGTVAGKNLYNPEDGTDDIYIHVNSNTIVGGSAYNTSNPISVIVGQTYTMTRANSIGHVDESGVLVSSQASTPNGSTTFVASQPFVRVSVLKANISSAQLEAGSTFTGFVPFKYEIPDDMLSYKGINGEKIKDNTLEATKFKGHVAGKNKFDKATVASGYLDPSSYQVTNSASYKYTQDFIDLVEGKTYTINNSRSVVFYDASENPKKGINNIYQTPITFTAEHPKMKISMANANVDTMQVERGTEVTEYKPYEHVIPLSAIESFEIGNGGGEAYDQPLNTTDNVSFNSVTTQTVNTDVLNTSGEIPTGTLITPPTGLVSGDVWADTTDSSEFPMLRVKL